MSRINENYISKLPDEVLAKILSIYPLDSGSKSVALLTDCDLDTLFVDALELKSLRYSGSLSRFRFYKVMNLEDVMFDFKVGSSCYGEKERFDYAGIRSITDVRVLTLHGWMYKGLFEPWLSLTKHFTLSKLEDLWWIDACMDDDNINSLFHFLKLCTSLKRLFITIDPRRTSSPKASASYHKSSKFVQKGKLDKLELVGLEGFSREEDIISFKEHLIKFFDAEPYVIEVRPGMHSRRLISMALESDNPSKFSYKFLDEVEDNISLCLKHPHMP